MADRYINVMVTVSRQRMDALHAARAAAGLSTLTDSQMLHQLVQAGETVELEALKLLTPEAA